MLPASDKKLRLFRAYSSGHPLWCAWQVTYRCNFRCRFCGYWHDPLGLQPEATLEQFKAGSAKLASLGTLLISLAGGEPLLRGDLPEIVAAIGEYHFPFVTTNGWLVDKAAAEALFDAGAWGVSVSIDYADAARHDKARGMAGAWEQAWHAVELLSAARRYKWQRVNVIAVLMDDNIDDMEPLLAMAAKRRAYFMVQPYGQLKTGSSRWAHNNGPVSPRLLDLRRRWPNFLSNPYYLGRFDAFHHGGVSGCRAGRAFFNIDSTGDVAICVERKDTPVANLYTDHIQKMRRCLAEGSRGNKCTSCWYNCRGEVESLYRPDGLLASLPTLFFDRGRAPGSRNGK